MERKQEIKQFAEKMDAEFLSANEFENILSEVASGAAKSAVAEYRKRHWTTKLYDSLTQLLVFLIAGTLLASGLVAAGWVFGMALKLLLGQ